RRAGSSRVPAGGGDALLPPLGVRPRTGAAAAGVAPPLAHLRGADPHPGPVGAAAGAVRLCPGARGGRRPSCRGGCTATVRPGLGAQRPLTLLPELLTYRNRA